MKRGEKKLGFSLRAAAAAVALLIAISGSGTGFAQKRGGILKMYSPDSPPTMSILEEATLTSQAPMMGVFNNLVMFDQHVKQDSLKSIVPDLATGWNWNEDGTEVTFPLRQGVRWHDGKPFTAADVVCTWDLLMEKSQEKLRFNPRKSFYKNLDQVTVNGDYEVTFHLKRPQPAFVMLLASGFSAIYPCDVPPAQMRQHPIGTGPFKFVEFKPNEDIKVARNPDYWKPGLPYLDGIEYKIIRNPATAVLAFVSGQVDMTFPFNLTIPLLKDVRNQVPQAICEVTPSGGVNRHVLVNRTAPPFDNRDLRRAMALSIDRKAFIDILTEGQGEIGGVLQPPPEGLWGMPPDLLKTLSGYDPDVWKNRTEARQIMEKLGYGPNHRLPIKVSTRDLPVYRDPAVILIDQLKQVYIDGELEMIDLARYFPKIMRKEFTAGLNLQTSGPDPDPILDLFYGCGSSLNWDGYCNPEVDKLIAQQSQEADEARRKQLVWKIERELAEDVARPIIFYERAATCWQPYVKGQTMMVNSIFNGNRREDVWLDK
ncbi:MAG: ABC transporter substrate-binding protein [Alphaproteobacteria bacterium]|nr:MAG: ABC transporter substrate-binding protein [Alphaproteobacteria bacterium]